MLRQLARLTTPVEAAGERACAIAVYADAADRILPAADTGFEGVACVDDTARAVVLLCDLWEGTRIPRIRDWALALTDFLVYMQLDDGRFLNFITDWSGRRNERGITSLPRADGFWHARGARALARASLVLGHESALPSLERALPHILDARDVPPDVRSIHVLMAIELLRARLIDAPAPLESWCQEIATCRAGDVLLDHADEDAPHLWAHLQEGVLAEAGAFLGRHDLVDIARRSALAYLAPLIDSGFDEPTVQPYGVASAVFCVERLSAATRSRRFDELVRLARAWFDGRNPARRAVYDRAEGRVYDGVDDGRINPHSGAESNVVGAQALVDQVVRVAPILMRLVEASFPPGVRERLDAQPETISTRTGRTALFM